MKYKFAKLWDRDAHLMTDASVTDSLDIGVDGLDDSLTTAMDIHSERHEEAIEKLNAIAS